MSEVIVESDKVEAVCPSVESEVVKIEPKVAIIECNETVIVIVEAKGEPKVAATECDKSLGSNDWST